LLAIELRRNEYRWLFPVLLVGAWLIVVEPLDRPVVFWADASVRLRSTLWLLGPFVGMIAAWMACRERRFATEDLIATTPRSVLQRRLICWAATVVYGSVVYALIGVYVLAWAAARSNWGGPDWGVILVGLLGIPAYAALGFGLGSAKPRRASAFVAFLGLGLIMLILSSDSLHRSAFLTPVPLVERSPWQGVTPAVASQQAVYLVGLTALGLGFVFRAYRRGWSSRLWVTAALAVMVIGFLGVADRAPDAEARKAALTGQDEPELGAPLPDMYVPVCSDGVIPVCVHPAYEPMLDEASDEMNRLLAALVDLPDRPVRVELLPVPRSEAPVGTVSYLLRSDDVNGLLMEASHRLAEALLYPAADLASAEAPPERPADGWQTRNVLIAWVLKEAGRPISCTNDQVSDHGGPRSKAFLAPCEPLQRFSALDPAIRQAWLRDHLADVRAGLVPVEELP
jgi:hypothetical protein